MSSNNKTMIEFFKDFKYRPVHSSIIRWLNPKNGNPSVTLTIIFMENGRGKRKVKVYGEYPNLAITHSWYHEFVVPWLSGLLTTEDVIFERHI